MKNLENNERKSNVVRVFFSNLIQPILLLFITSFLDIVFVLVLKDIGYFTWLLRCYTRLHDMYLNICDVTAIWYFTDSIMGIGAVGSIMLFIMLLFHWIPKLVSDILCQEQKTFIDSKKKKYYVNFITNLPECDYDHRCVGLCTGNRWSGEGSFSGWYAAEYYNRVFLLCFGIQNVRGGEPYDIMAPFDGGVFEAGKKYYDKIQISSLYQERVFMASNDEEAIAIFKQQKY